VDSGAAELPRLRRSAKRNIEFKCEYDEEVTEAERESEALKCTKAGCETN
jgi:hypothetical protein